MNIGINFANVMSRSDGIKGGSTGEALQEQCFPWESRAPVGSDFGLVNFQVLLHAEKPI